MVKTKEDLTGWIMSEHGIPDSKLIVICQADDYVSKTGKHYAMWSCKCNCGSDKIITLQAFKIKNGVIKSCGCKHKENIIYYNKNKHKKYNKYDLSGPFGIGWTTNTNKEFYFDLEDYDKIKKYAWHEDITNNYSCLKASIENTNKTIRMSDLLGFKYYDHINRNTLDNRKENFRLATSSENGKNKSKSIKNTSGITGVYYHSLTNKWSSKICVNYEVIHLGEFINKDDAIIARLQAEAKYFKEFAPQKHLFAQYGI